MDASEYQAPTPPQALFLVCLIGLFSTDKSSRLCIHHFTSLMKFPSLEQSRDQSGD